MNLETIMNYHNFVVLGNTLDEEKYAYKIKHALLEKGYNVQCVGRELININDVQGEIDVIVMCINHHKGLKLLMENTKKVKVVLIQPGAESEEIYHFLSENRIEYIDGCALVGLSLYRK